MARPRPSPPNSRAMSSLACSNAVKMVSCAAGAMPMPSSTQDSRSCDPSSCTSRRTWPRTGVNLTALRTMFHDTCCSRAASPSTVARVACQCTDSSICFSPAVSCTISTTTSLGPGQPEQGRRIVEEAQQAGVEAGALRDDLQRELAQLAAPLHLHAIERGLHLQRQQAAQVLAGRARGKRQEARTVVMARDQASQLAADHDGHRHGRARAHVAHVLEMHR